MRFRQRNAALRTIRDLAKAMASQQCSAVIVTRHDGSHAVVTERDICGALATDSDPDADWAVDVMTVELLTLDADQRIVEAARLIGPLLASTHSPT